MKLQICADLRNRISKSDLNRQLHAPGQPAAAYKFAGTPIVSESIRAPRLSVAACYGCEGHGAAEAIPHNGHLTDVADCGFRRIGVTRELIETGGMKKCQAASTSSALKRDPRRPPYPAIMPPPSTTTVEPVENGVDAKNKTAFATSEDCPIRLVGNRSATLANIASRSVSAIPAHNGVAISPGETAFTLIGASSRARLRASASSAALTAPCRTVSADGRTLRKLESENPGRSF